MSNEKKCPGCKADRESAEGETPITYACGTDISEIADGCGGLWNNIPLRTASCSRLATRHGIPAILSQAR